MTGYTKLFHSIVTSTIWTEDDQTRIVWVTMLAIADQHGEVHASIPGLARVAAVPVSAVETAIDRFLSPDVHSRTKDCEGRRIEPVDGGWAIINHSKYRHKMSHDEKREKAAERKRRERARKVGSVTPDVTQCHDLSRMSRQAEAEAEANTDLKREREGRFPEVPPMSRKEFDVLADARGVPKECAEWFWNTHDARSWTDATGQPIRKVEPLLMNTLVKWRANPKEFKNGKHSNNSKSSDNRATGTLNEGKSSQYAGVGKVV